MFGFRSDFSSVKMWFHRPIRVPHDQKTMAALALLL